MNPTCARARAKSMTEFAPNELTSFRSMAFDPPLHRHHHLHPHFHTSTTFCNQLIATIKTITNTRTHLLAMFRRVATAVPAQAGRVFATAARPSIASPLRTAAPTVSAAGRRQYHEKDKSHLCATQMMDEAWQVSEPFPSRNSHPSLAPRRVGRPANICSTARPLQQASQCRFHVEDRH